MVEARYYEKLAENRVKCFLCPVHCTIPDGKKGRCLGRTNQGGILYASNYGQVVSIALDPIEKKPLYHFYPGSTILSVAPNGCNLTCPFCQNWEISQTETRTRYVPPDQLIKRAGQNGSIGISYTYTEPLIWFEYLMDVCPTIQKQGFKNVLVTNGMIEEKPLDELLPYINAMNIDLKSIRPDFYKKIIKGDLTTVQNTIRRAKNSCHIELTNLLIPTLNDSLEEIDELICWVAALDKQTVLHFSRYFPQYKLDLPVTPTSTLVDAYRRAKQHLSYVYLGNLWDADINPDTVCPQCQSTLISRSHFQARVVGVTDRTCTTCGRKVDIVL